MVSIFTHYIVLHAYKIALLSLSLLSNWMQWRQPASFRCVAGTKLATTRVLSKQLSIYCSVASYRDPECTGIGTGRQCGVAIENRRIRCTLVETVASGIVTFLTENMHVERGNRFEGGGYNSYWILQSTFLSMLW
jgi:hypothetical protein